MATGPGLDRPIPDYISDAQQAQAQLPHALMRTRKFYQDHIDAVTAAVEHRQESLAHASRSSPRKADAFG